MEGLKSSSLQGPHGHSCAATPGLRGGWGKRVEEAVRELEDQVPVPPPLLLPCPLPASHCPPHPHPTLSLCQVQVQEGGVGPHAGEGG